MRWYWRLDQRAQSIQQIPAGWITLWLLQGHRQGADATDEVGVESHRWSHDLDLEIACQDFFPKNTELQLGQPVADAAMDAGTERQVMARPRAADAEGLCIV